MANEIEIHGSSGLTLYGLVRNASGQVWRPATPAFENYNSANYANYATTIAFVEQGATGVYLGAFPVAILAGNYRLDARRQAAGSPAVSDVVFAAGNFSWDGAAEVLGGSTPAQIADAVWDEVAADHNTAGTTGAKLNSAASAGDPWSTALPGAYAAGEAGYIVGNNLDAQISDLLGETISPPRIGEDCGDVQVFDAGEKRPVYASLEALSGAITINSATVTLKTAAGATVGTLSAIAATGIDAGALTTSRAWFTLNTLVPNGADAALAVGTYALEFKITATGSDTIQRIHEIEIVIQVV